MDSMDSDIEAICARIETGMTTERDAADVRRSLKRMAAYERALRWITLYGQGECALRAARAISGVEAEADRAIV